MRRSCLILFLLFSIYNSYGADCIEFGEAVPHSPSAPNCCEGLILEADPERRDGVKGICLLPCVKKGQPIPVLRYRPKCCDGLVEGSNPYPEALGAGPVCIDLNESCINIGESVPVTPEEKRICCPGLVLKSPEPGVYGIKGTCVVDGTSGKSVHESRTLTKEPMVGTGIIHTPSSNKKAKSE
jgi:hypothetical protein